MKRIMGLDYGDARIGIAFSDMLHMLATGYENYKRVNLDTDLIHFEKLIKEKEVEKIIIGLPLNLQGVEQEIAKKVRGFGSLLSEKFNLEVIFFDERLTSQIADDILKKSGYDWKERKNRIDMLSAEIILQDYLDSKKE